MTEEEITSLVPTEFTQLPRGDDTGEKSRPKGETLAAEEACVLAPTDNAEYLIPKK